MALRLATCRFCLEEKKLSKCSHIIPEFMYKGLRKNKSQPFIVDKIKSVVEGNANPIYSRKGEFEAGILCIDCENFFNQEFETYANNIIYGDGLIKETEKPVFENHFYIGKDGKRMEFTLCKNIDYAKFKLFLLSILWRASISSRPFFNEIKLGPHQERIRKLLREKNAGDEKDYPVFFLSMKRTRLGFLQAVYQPREIKFDSGLPVYHFPIGGFIYQFVVCSREHNIPAYFVQEGLTRNGEMRIYHIPPKESVDFFKSYFHLNEI